MRDPIRILIVDDHAVVRKALAHFLNSEEDMGVIGEASDGVQAVEMARSHQPDVVLMDYNMPEMNGAEATRQIVAEHSNIQVIGLSMHDDGPVETAMLEAGAVAYCTKDGHRQSLLSTIQKVAEFKMQ